MRIKIIVFIFLAFILFSNQVFAESSYVLPYPSAMPGSFFYKLELVKEYISGFWYFGDFGHFKYNLQESDKYLVEAKTLFDYKQYLLGVNALEKSNDYFLKVEPSLIMASKHGKNIMEKVDILNGAAQKHIEELSKISQITPATFEWRPEKSQSTQLDIRGLIIKSLEIRKAVL